MTFATRHTFAASHSSSMVAFRFRRHSRRASRATSSPILFRYLSKTYNSSPQSPTVTTVPAGLNVTLTGAPQTNAGSYPVTASVTDNNYQGSASDTFVIARAAATMVLSNLSKLTTVRRNRWRLL